MSGRNGVRSSTVNHSAKEDVNTGGFHHTNTAESHFALFKRGVYGTSYAGSWVTA